MKRKINISSFPIYLTVYASFFDIHAQLPILALFAASAGATSFWIGAIVGIYSVFNIVGNAAGGMAIDRFGWRKPLLCGLVLVTAVLFAYQLVDSTISLLIVRAMNGLAGGILIPSTLTALSPESASAFKPQHNRNVAFFGISIGLAALTGPPFAGIISSLYSFKTAYLCIAILMTLATIFSFIFTKEKVSAHKPRQAKKSMYFKLPPVSLTACLFSFALMGGTGTLAAFLPLLAEQRGFNQGGIGMLFGMFAMMVILLQAWRAVSGWTRYKPFYLTIGGIGAIIAALLIIDLVIHRFFFATAVVLYGVGYGIVFPTILVLVMQGISLEKKGIITGIFFSFYSLGTAVVPPLAGFIWERADALSPPLTAIVIILLLTGLATWSYRKVSKTPAAPT